MKNKYYYSFTRNLTKEQEENTYCGRPSCIGRDDCECMSKENGIYKKVDNKKWTGDNTHLNNFSYNIYENE